MTKLPRRDIPPPTPRKRATPSQIEAILTRQGGSCAVCRARIGEGGAAYAIDHIVPLELTGAHASDNLQALCGPCHALKTAADAGRIAKARRLRGDSCAGPPARPLKSRGFSKLFSRRFDGSVVARAK